MVTLLLTIVAICVVLPNRYVVAALPAMWAAQSLAPKRTVILFSTGPVDLLAMDLVLIVVIIRFVLTLVLQKELVFHGTLYTAIAIFLGVNLAATLLAGIKFGEEHLFRCLVSWMRLVAEILLVAILGQSVRTLAQARRSIVIVVITLGALVAIQFINFLGAKHGFAIGEVQGVEREQLRYFGPVGDSVGFVLLLGYLISLCFARFVSAVAFLGGIILTGGVGAMLGIAVGTVLFALFGRQGPAVRASVRRHAWALPVLCLAIALGAAFAAKPLARTLVERVSSGSYGESGGQRITTGRVAAAMIVDNPLLGVGYMGFQSVLGNYGGDKFFDLDDPSGATANANNQLLQSLSDSGVFGLVACIGLICCAARLFARIARSNADFFLSTVYLGSFLWLLTQIFGNLAAVWLTPASYVARFFWILLGVAVAVDRLLAGEPAEECPLRDPRGVTPQLASA